MDGSGIQNVPNSSKTICRRGKKNRTTKNPKKFKINVLGVQMVNGNSHVKTTKTSKTHDIALFFMEVRYHNTESNELKSILEEKIKASQLTDKEINNILIEKTISKDQFQKKINKSLNDSSLNTTEMANKISKQCQKEKLDNEKKKDNIKRSTIEKQINDQKLYEFFKNEKQIILILDNYSPHKSKLIKLLCKILNMKLIFLPSYSPHLNPIEQVWRTIKNRLSRKYYSDKKILELKFLEIFKEVVNKKSFYEEWIKKYLKNFW